MGVGLEYAEFQMHVSPLSNNFLQAKKGSKEHERSLSQKNKLESQEYLKLVECVITEAKTWKCLNNSNY